MSLDSEKQPEAGFRIVRPQPTPGPSSSQLHAACSTDSSILDSESNMLENIQKALTIRNATIRELLAEALGMFILMVFGLSSVAQVVLGRGQFGQYISINVGFGFGVTLGILAAGGISGAHLNAAITLTNCLLGNLPWRKLPAYLSGQFLGSFIAAATVFILYYDALYDYTKGNFTVVGPTATASIFSTYPAPHVSVLGGFFSEFLATAVLLLGILIIHDKKNDGGPKGLQALLTGILVQCIGMGMGLNTGYSMNPSRDLPPRIFTAIAGWGMDVFKAGHHWWWVPLTAPVLGSLAGVLIHKLIIDFHNQTEPECKNEKDQPVVETSTL